MRKARERALNQIHNIRTHTRLLGQTDVRLKINSASLRLSAQLLAPTVRCSRCGEEEEVYAQLECTVTAAVTEVLMPPRINTHYAQVSALQ